MAIGTHPEHNQETQHFLLETDFEVDAVDPQVHLVAAALPEVLGLVLPLLVSRVIIVADELWRELLASLKARGLIFDFAIIRSRDVVGMP